MTDEPILRRGDHGDWVSHLQRLLVKAGHDPGPVDGEFGDRTQVTVWAFQSAYELAVDGVIGPDSWFVLHLPPNATASAEQTTRQTARPIGTRSWRSYRLQLPA